MARADTKLPENVGGRATGEPPGPIRGSPRLHSAYGWLWLRPFPLPWGPFDAVVVVVSVVVVAGTVVVVPVVVVLGVVAVVVVWVVAGTPPAKWRMMPVVGASVTEVTLWPDGVRYVPPSWNDCDTDGLGLTSATPPV